MTESTVSGAAHPAAPDQHARAKMGDADGLKQIKDEFSKKLEFLIWFATFSEKKADRLAKSMPAEQIREAWLRDGRILVALVGSLAVPGKALIKLVELSSFEP